MFMQTMEKDSLLQNVFFLVFVISHFGRLNLEILRFFCDDNNEDAPGDFNFIDFITCIYD